VLGWGLRSLERLPLNPTLPKASLTRVAHAAVIGDGLPRINLAQPRQPEHTGPATMHSSKRGCAAKPQRVGRGCQPAVPGSLPGTTSP
jgi:hypothetical protein